MRKIYRLGNRGKVLVPHSVHQGIAYAGGKNKCVGSSPSDTLVRVSKGSFHERQSAMPCTAGVSGNVPEGKEIKNADSPVDCPQNKWKPLVRIQYIKQHFITKTVTCLFPVCHR